MALGKRAVKQTELFVPVNQRPQTPAHLFYGKLNTCWLRRSWIPWSEISANLISKEGGRPHPDRHLFSQALHRLLEGIDSQRGIAWRCARAQLHDRHPPAPAGNSF